MKELNEFMKGDESLRLLLKRGETENLGEHWKQEVDAENAAFSNLL